LTLNVNLRQGERAFASKRIQHVNGILVARFEIGHTQRKFPASWAATSRVIAYLSAVVPYYNITAPGGVQGFYSSKSCDFKEFSHTILLSIRPGVSSADFRMIPCFSGGCDLYFPQKTKGLCLYSISCFISS